MSFKKNLTQWNKASISMIWQFKVMIQTICMFLKEKITNKKVKQKLSNHNNSLKSKDRKYKNQDSMISTNTIKRLSIVIQL